MNISDLLPWFSFALVILVTIGGGLAFRQNYSKSADEIQKRVIEALTKENETLEKRLQHCEEATNNLKVVIDTIQAALKRRGIIVTIDGELVTITDASSSSSASIRRHPRKPTTIPKTTN